MKVERFNGILPCGCVVMDTFFIPKRTCRHHQADNNGKITIKVPK